MKRYLTLGSLFAVLAAGLILATVPGCPDAKKPVAPPPPPKEKVDGDGKEKKDGAGAPGKGEPLAVKAWDGVVKGKVSIDGTAPTMGDIDMKGHADAPQCHEPKKQDWIVSKDGGVANVIVILEPPAGKFFAIDKKLAEEYKAPWIDQPHCVYEPHVAAIFAAYKGQDGKSVETGLKLLVKNTGKISHNTKIKGELKYNPVNGQDVPPAQERTFPITYQKSPIDIACDKHNWMTAKLVAFDHPFFAVTKADGTYEINNVPTDVELTVKMWHEVAGSVTDKAHTFKKGDNAVDLKVKS